MVQHGTAHRRPRANRSPSIAADLMSRSRKLLRLPQTQRTQPYATSFLNKALGTRTIQDYFALRLSTHHTIFIAQSLRGRAGCSPRESARNCKTSACDHGN